MVIFLDTSATYALADRSDPNHSQAKTLFEQALKQGDTFLLHNYILLESAALFSRRLGWQVAHKFLSEAESFQTRWVDEALHHTAVHKWMEKRSKNISLVDQVSFLVMEEMKIQHALAFDDDFSNEGFTIYKAN